MGFSSLALSLALSFRIDNNDLRTPWNYLFTGLKQAKQQQQKKNQPTKVVVSMVSIVGFFCRNLNVQLLWNNKWSEIILSGLKYVQRECVLWKVWRYSYLRLDSILKIADYIYLTVLFSLIFKSIGFFRNTKPIEWLFLSRSSQKHTQTLARVWL